MSLPPTDTRHLFRPVAEGLVSLLRELPESDWESPTIAGPWRVRDVVAHIVDLSLRRLSFHRDRMAPPPPTRPINSAQDFVAFINDINAQWVTAARRLSPRVLTDLADLATSGLAAWFEGLPIDAPALFGVSWAGESESAGWFDVGREYTELWHHQQQIRLAVHAPLLNDAALLRPVIEIGLRALPFAYRDVGETGDAVAIEIAGAAGGAFSLERRASGWTLGAGAPAAASTRVLMSDDAAWRLLFHALKGDEASARIQVLGRRELAAPLFSARAVIVSRP